MTEKEAPRPKPPECDSCHFETKRLKRYARAPLAVEKGDKWLCVLCASTLAGNALDYPSNYPDPAALRTICYVGNVILAAIAERQEL